MAIRTPRLEIFTRRIEENARSVIHLCHSQNVAVACVTKVVMAHPGVVTALEAAGADWIADSRIPNLQTLAVSGAHPPRMLLRTPAPSSAADVVRSADLSLNSSLETLKLLSAAAASLKRIHQVIIMVDVGDLREGVMPDRAPALVKEASRLPNLEVVGLGTNLACFGGVIPSVENMQKLIDVRSACRRASGLELPILSGGNSANLPLLASGSLPAEINQLRIGEAIMFGRNVIDRSPWQGARQDTFRIIAEVIELERKPSIPQGARGQDAFGGALEFVDRGDRLRAICNIGRQDVAIDGLTPLDPGMLILGGSSDHLVLDVEEAAQPLKIGAEIGFFPNYAALLAASTSPFIQKVVIEE